MVIDEAYRLHPGVDDGWATVFEASLFQVFGQAFGDRGLGRSLAIVGKVVLLRAVVHEAPDVSRERLAFGC